MRHGKYGFFTRVLATLVLVLSSGVALAPTTIAAPMATGTVPGSYLFRPSGGDDAPKLLALISSGARTIQLADNSTFRINSPLVFPVETPVRLIGSPSVVLAVNVAQGALGSSQFGLLSDGYGPAAGAGVLTTLSANAAVGANQVTLVSAAGLSVGSPIILSGASPGLRAVQSAYVLALPGSGVVKLGTKEGAPISLAYAFNGSSQTNVYLSPGFPRGIHIEGNGMTISGSGGGLFEFLSAWECSLSGVKFISNSVSSWVAFFDIGSRDCLFADLTVQQLASGSPPPMAIGLAYTIGSSIFRTHVDGPFGAAGSFALAAARSFTVDGCTASNGATGMMLTSEAGPPGANDTTGERWGEVRNFVSINSSVTGINIQDGGSGYSILDSTSIGSPDGLLINTQNTSTYPDNLRIVGGTYQGSTAGIKIGGGAKLRLEKVNVSGSGVGIFFAGTASTTGTALVDVNADSCTTYGVEFTGSAIADVLIDGGSARGTTGAGVYFAGSGPLVVRKLDLTDAGIGTSGTGQLVGAAAGASIVLEDVTFGYSGDPANTSYGILDNSGASYSLTRVTWFFPSTPGQQLAAVGAGSAAGVFRMVSSRIVSNGVVGANTNITFGLLTNAACTLLDLGGCDFSFAAAPAGFNVVPNTNWGTWTANGASDVTISNVASPGAQAVLSHAMVTPGGTLGAPFQSTALSGGSMKVRSVAGDAAVRRWVLR